MNYNLNQKENNKKEKINSLKSLKKLFPYLKKEKKDLVLSLIFITLSSALALLAPILIGKTVDKYIIKEDFHGVLIFSLMLLIIYILSTVFKYLQTVLMGKVGQEILFALRKGLFSKLQSLPIAFFNQNKIGDLISRINNDTDKLNQFFSQALMQFIGSFFSIIGAGIFLISLKLDFGMIILIPAIFILIFTKIISPWIKKKNLENLNQTGNLSSEIEESLNNFKVIVAYDRRDYLREKFIKVNENTYKSGV